MPNCIKKVMKLSIVIPCYNESDSIKLLIKKLKSILNKDIEVILVDNGSNDQTSETIESIKFPENIKVLKLKENLGYGNGIIQGLKKTTGEVVSWTHADLQTDPNDVIKGYKKYKQDLIKKQCIVKGRRKNQTFFEKLITWGMSIYCSFLLGTRLIDINAQPKIFHRSFIDLFNSPPLDFSFDLYMMYSFKKQKIKIETIPVYFEKRLHGEPKGGGGNLRGKLKIIIKTIKYVKRLKKNI